jgi:hypothetical protein
MGTAICSKPFLTKKTLLRIVKIVAKANKREEVVAIVVGDHLFRFCVFCCVRLTRCSLNQACVDSFRPQGYFFAANRLGALGI